MVSQRLNLPSSPTSHSSVLSSIPTFTSDNSTLSSIPTFAKNSPRGPHISLKPESVIQSIPLETQPKPLAMQSTVVPPRPNEELSPLIDAHIEKVLEEFKKTEDDFKPDEALITDLENPSAQLAATIDHTLLKPEATEEQIKSLCEEAIKHGFKSCCVNPTHIRLTATTLLSTPTIACSVIGFPLGASSTAVKCYEASLAILDGAREIDMVIPIGHLRSKNYSFVYNDILSVVRAAKGTPVKVIIETSLLPSDDLKIAACWIAAEAGASWVKTSTGFNGGGATVEDVRLMRLAVAHKEGVKVKASGGVRDFEAAVKMIKAGASRIGTSNGVAIMQAGKAGEGY